MKSVKHISLGAILLIGIFLILAMYPSNVKADPAGFTPMTPEVTTQVPTTQVPTTQVPTTQAPTTQAPTTQAPTTQAPTTEVPTDTPTPTISPTVPVDLPTTPPPREKASKTPEPLLPETGEKPIDPTGGSGNLVLAVLAVLGISGGIVLGISQNAEKEENPKDS
jgi:cytoskeletal protein RodZ